MMNITKEGLLQAESKPVAWRFKDFRGRWGYRSVDHQPMQIKTKYRASMEPLYAAPSVSAQDASPKDGWALMPKRMTPELAWAMENCYFAEPKPVPVRSIEYAIWEQVYNALIAARPEPPHD